MSSHQMRVAHLVQRLLELGNPALEHLFKEGGRANMAAQEREPLTGDRNLRWQWEERLIAALRDHEEGLASAEGPYVPLHDVECSRELLRRAHRSGQCSQ